MFIIRVLILLLFSSSFLQAKYYKCFYFHNEAIDYSNSIALFIENKYVSIMDNIYYVNAKFTSEGSDAQGDFSIYKKEAKDFLYQAKLYKGSLTLILTRKNSMDNKNFEDTTYKCQNPDNMKEQDNDIPVIISPK